jgi:hypothetical protein
VLPALFLFCRDIEISLGLICAVIHLCGYIRNPIKIGNKRCRKIFFIGELGALFYVLYWFFNGAV